MKDTTVYVCFSMYAPIELLLIQYVPTNRHIVFSGARYTYIHKFQAHNKQAQGTGMENYENDITMSMKSQTTYLKKVL